MLEESCQFKYFYFETPRGLADLTAPTVLDVVPHSSTIAERHLPCSCGNLDKRSI